MATIHCKACGKSYNYEKNGCCPECGAYNRPPRREQVYADGTVHHLDGSSRRPVPNGDKVCYERKENHQKKVCFEDQARQVREKLNNLSRPARQVSLVGVLVGADHPVPGQLHRLQLSGPPAGLSRRPGHPRHPGTGGGPGMAGLGYLAGRPGGPVGRVL